MPFKKIKLATNQTVNDIQTGMVEMLQSEYSQFLPIPDILGLSNNWTIATRQIFDFLKQKCTYKIESDREQRIMTAKAILHYCSAGIDCKNFAMFSAGTMLAWCQQHNKRLTVSFRFAAYETQQIEHVFCVVSDGTKSIWIDPVLDYFNSREPDPYLWEDINLNNMALYKIGKVSGVDSTDTDLGNSGGGGGIVSTILDLTKTNQELLEALFQVFGKSGVKPGIFAKYQFLAILDSSTGKWKSRSAFLQDYTPNERIAFYIEAMQSNEDCTKTIIQYPELYYHQQLPGKGTPSDVGKVDAKLLATYNLLVERNYLKGADSFQCGKWVYPKSYLILPGGNSSILDNFLPSETNSDGTPKTANVFGTIAILGLVGAAAYWFTKSKKRSY